MADTPQQALNSTLWDKKYGTEVVNGKAIQGPPQLISSSRDASTFKYPAGTIVKESRPDGLTKLKTASIISPNGQEKFIHSDGIPSYGDKIKLENKDSIVKPTIPGKPNSRDKIIEPTFQGNPDIRKQLFQPGGLRGRNGFGGFPGNGAGGFGGTNTSAQVTPKSKPTQVASNMPKPSAPPSSGGKMKV